MQVLRYLGRYTHRVVISNHRLLALDQHGGNDSGQTLGVEQGSRSEAFSMRRRGGSRWLLRRARCATG